MIRRATVSFILLLLACYKKFISPFLPNACRFHPSCSDYSASAFRKYGILRGFWFTLLRLMRCNPFCTGGYDPLR